MYKIICTRNKEHSNMNPLISNYIDIMNSYNKGILIFELLTDNIYTNEVIEKIFEINKNDLKITNFINKIRENKILLNNTEKEIYINDFNTKITVSLKNIKEKKEIKYIICTIEDIFLLNESNDHKKIDEMILENIIGNSKEIIELKKKIKKASKQIQQFYLWVIQEQEKKCLQRQYIEYLQEVIILLLLLIVELYLIL